MNINAKPILGVSSCLLGEAVRYDGTDKYAGTLVEHLSAHFELRGFCPEVAIGLGIPRETIELVASDSGEIRCLGTQTAELDVSTPLRASVVKRQAEFSELSGYLVKARSPSCGLGSTPLYGAGPPGKRKLVGYSSGLFTASLSEYFPNLPIAQEDNLADALMLETFVARIKNYYHYHKHIEH